MLRSGKRMIIVVLSIAVLLGIWYFFRSNYVLYINSKDFNFRHNTKVIFNDRNVGELKEIQFLRDSNVLLVLSIKPSIKIPTNAKHRYFENIFGDGYISFESYGKTTDNWK